MPEYVLAIDFGTSVTLAAARAGDGPVERVRFAGDDRIPSAVVVGDDGRLCVGPDVVEEALINPTRVEWTPKRNLGQGPVILAGRVLRDVDLVAAVLEHVRQEARRMFNGRPASAVRLTHPAVWADARLAALQEAAARAGLARLELVEEPVAAAAALAAHGRLDEVPVGSLLALYDLGGGTFDTVLLRRTGPVGFEILGQPGGDERLGGEDLDDKLVNHLAERYLDDEQQACLRDPDRSSDPAGWRRADHQLRLGARRAKERLATAPAVKFGAHPLLGREFVQLSRADLEQIAGGLVRKSADLLATTLERNGLDPAEVTAICLAGGSSRLALVKRVLGTRFDRPIATHGDPKALTAEGALESTGAGQDPAGALREALRSAWAEVRGGEVALSPSLRPDLERMARWGPLRDRLGVELPDRAELRRAIQAGNRRWGAMEVDAPPRQAAVAEAMRRAYTVAFAELTDQANPPGDAR